MKQSNERESFEDTSGHKPQYVVDLVPLPSNARSSGDAETYVNHIRHVHQVVHGTIKSNKEKYKANVDVHQRNKEFKKVILP